MTWQEMADRAIRGEPAEFDDALAVLEAPDADVLEILDAAYRVRRHHFGNEVRLNYLINAKSGLCSEDCSYCSQARGSGAEIEKYPLLTREEIATRAERGVGLGASTCCIVLSGRGPTRKDLQGVAAAVREVKSRHPDLHVCACLGMLTEEEGRLLADAGVDRYNHNLNTAESHHGEIVRTHTHDDRMATIGAARHAGLSVCSGIIVGMGETRRQLVEVAFEVRESGADSIPVNFLLPVAGTPFGDRDPGLTPTFCLRVLAMFRFVCPDRELRVSAGRETHLRSLQPMALYAANSLFVADYLTEPGQDPGLDHAMIEDLGFTIA